MEKAPFYFPIERGLYEVAAGLRPLGFDFGNPHYDSKIFHIAEDFPLYRQNMLECRDERLSKYFCLHNISEERIQTLTKFLVHRLVLEYPEIFSFSEHTLFCKHTGDTLKFSDNYDLVSFKSSETFNTPVLHPIDALSLQVPEDLAYVCRDLETSKDHLGLLHLCTPSHWAAEDKIGMNFFDIHTPIPEIEKVNRVASKLVDMMINKGPFVRFIWSFVTDKRLNHHPIAPLNFDQETWKGRSFDEFSSIPFYFRIERQVTFGFQETQTALFTIGVTFLSGLEVKNNPHQRSQLISALHSMTPASRVYKGVDECFDKLIEWLNS